MAKISITPARSPRPVPLIVIPTTARSSTIGCRAVTPLTSTTAYMQENQHQVQDIFAVNEYYWTVLTGTPTTMFNNTQQQITTVRKPAKSSKSYLRADQSFSWLSGFFYSDTTVDEHGLRTFPARARRSLRGFHDHHIRPVRSLDLEGDTFDLADHGTALQPRRHQLSNRSACPAAARITAAGSAANNTLVGDIALKQQLTGDVMSYVSYSRGYSPAAYNTSANLTSNASLVPVSRERHR